MKGWTQSAADAHEARRTGKAPQGWGKQPEPPKERAKPRQEESRLQKACITWFRAQYPALYRRLWSVPNAGKMPVHVGKRFKDEGCLAGVPDLCLSIPRGNWAGAFFELKVGANTTSEAQEAFIAEHSADYYCVVCRTLEEFVREVTMYLNLETE